MADLNKIQTFIFDAVRRFSLKEVKTLLSVMKDEKDIDALLKQKMDFEVTLSRCETYKSFDTLVVDDEFVEFQKDGQVLMDIAMECGFPNETLLQLNQFYQNADNMPDYKAEFPEDCYYAMMALDPENLGMEAVTRVQDQLNFIEANRKFVPTQKFSDFGVFEGKTIPPVVTYVPVKGSVKMNNHYYSPVASVQEVVKLCKTKKIKDVVKCIKQIVAKINAPLVFDRRGVRSKSAKKEVVVYQQRKQSKSELMFCSSVNDNKEDQARVAFVEMAMNLKIDFDFDPYDVSIKELLSFYENWVKNQETKVLKQVGSEIKSSPKLDKKPKVEEKPEPNDDSCSSKDGGDESIKLDFDSVNLDEKLITETIHYYDKTIEDGDLFYTVTKQGNVIKLPYALDGMAKMGDFKDYLTKSHLISMHKILFKGDNFDETINMFIKLYDKNVLGNLRSQLVKNIKYIHYRYTRKSTTSGGQVPALFVLFEIYQMYFLTKDALMKDYIRPVYWPVFMDVVILFWLDQIKAKVKPNKNDLNLFIKDYVFPGSNETGPTAYTIGTKKKNGNGGGGFDDDGNDNDVYF